MVLVLYFEHVAVLVTGVIRFFIFPEVFVEGFLLEVLVILEIIEEALRMVDPRRCRESRDTRPGY